MLLIEAIGCEWGKPSIFQRLHEQESRERSTQKFSSSDSTSKTTLLDLINVIVLKDSILTTNFFSNVGHNIEFQLLNIFLLSANFIINCNAPLHRVRRRYCNVHTQDEYSLTYVRYVSVQTGIRVQKHSGNIYSKLLSQNMI